MRYVGLAIGVGLLGAGAYFLVTGLQQVMDVPLGTCFGPDCFDLSAAFLTLPSSIFMLVIGGIVTMASVTAIRRRSPGALGGISGLSALGALFVLMGGAFLVVFTTTSSIVGGTFVLLAVTFFATGIALLGVDQWLAARRRRATRLRTAGMRGTATILGVSDSNVTINNDPMVNLRLRVSIPNHPPYEVSKRQLISRIAIGQFVPGAVLPVLVDPAEPQDVMIDEAGGLAAPPAGGPVVRLGSTESMPGGASLEMAGGTLSPDLMATIGDALRRAADQFSAGQLGVAGGTTTITVNGQTFQVPGGAGQTVVIEPSGRIITTPAAGSAMSGPASAGTGAGAAATTAPAGGGIAPAAGASAGGAVPPGPVPPVGGVVGGTPAGAGGAQTSGATSATGPANGRVSIESFHDTGTQLGDLCLYSFELTVSPAGGQPYRVPHAALVPSAQVPRLIRGASFPAVINPSLPGGLGVFWDR